MTALGHEGTDAVMRATLLGSPEQALERFATLKQPDAATQRWAGVAHLWLAQQRQGQDLLESAAQRGECGAHLHLAYLHRLHGNLGFAEAELQAAGVLSKPLDRCFEVQQWSLLRFAQDRLREASELLASGWSLTYQTEFGAILRPALALTQGVTLYTLGEHRAALRWLEQAGEGSAGQAVYAHGWRAASFAWLGEVQSALDALEQAEGGLGGVPVARAMHLYQKGVTLRLVHHRRAALEALESCVAVAQSRGEEETEALGLLAWAGMLLDSSETAAHAGPLLARAKRLCRSLSLQALHAYRSAQFNRREQPEHSAEVLHRTAETLEQLERYRDALCATLNEAEAWLSGGYTAQGTAALEKAAQRFAALGGLDLGAELGGLPEVRRTLSTLPPSHPLRALLPAPLPHLEIRVLGEAALFLDGTRVSLGYRDAPEYLYYLLRRPGVSSTALAAELRPDQAARQTKLYLSGLGAALGKTGWVKFLNTPTTGVRLEWLRLEVTVDAYQLEALLERGQMHEVLERYRRLLPEGGEWAQAEADLLHHRVMHTGLSTLSRQLQHQQFQEARELAERLLLLEPFDVAVGAVLLEAVEKDQGYVHAVQRARALEAHYLREGLPSPMEVKRFLN